MSERAFLTEKRRAILDGETAEDMEIADGTYREHRWRTKQQAQAALAELIEVAESPAIDTREIFEPDQVFLLLRAILSPDDYTGPFYPPTESGEYATEEAQDWVNYHNRLYVQLDKLLAEYRNATVDVDD